MLRTCWRPRRRRSPATRARLRGAALRAASRVRRWRRRRPISRGPQAPSGRPHAGAARGTGGSPPVSAGAGEGAVSGSTCACRTAEGLVEQAATGRPLGQRLAGARGGRSRGTRRGRRAPEQPAPRGGRRYNRLGPVGRAHVPNHREGFSPCLQFDTPDPIAWSTSSPGRCSIARSHRPDTVVDVRRATPAGAPT